MRHLLFLAILSLAAPRAIAAAPGSGPESFTGSFRMEVHTFKNGKESKHSPVNMLFWIRPDMLLYQMELPGKAEQMRMLTDMRSNWTYTLMDDGQGNRTAMKMRLPGLEDSGRGEGDNAQITVTKETKVIQGHTCTKVIATSKEGTWTGWVAKGLHNGFAEMVRSLRGDAAEQSRHARGDVEGFPLEYEWVPAKGDERVVCYIKDLVSGKVDDALFDLSGYQVMELPSFAMPQR